MGERGKVKMMNEKDTYSPAARKEMVQVAAMAFRFLLDIS